MTGRQLRMTTSSTGQRLIVEGRVFFALCAMPYFSRFCAVDFETICKLVLCIDQLRFRIWRAHLPCIVPATCSWWRCSWTLSSAFDGGRLQSLLQTPGVMLPRRGESQISLIKSADLTSWQED